MKLGTQAGADRRPLLSAALLGAGMGLGLGAIYMQAGLAHHGVERQQALAMAEAAYSGYAGSYLEAQGKGLRFGLERYGFRSGADAQIVAVRYDKDRGAAKTKKRADLQCMTEAVYYEARGEGSRGQYAVAQVVMNRVKHPAFPKSVCGVVFQGAGRSGCQFSFACDGSMRRGRELLAWQKARSVASRMLAGAATGDIGLATHFHTTAVSPYWAPSMRRVAQVGTHVFYRFSPRKNGLAAPGLPMEQAMLVSAPADQVPALQLTPIVEKAIEASLEPVSDTAAKSAQPPAAKPAEAAALTPAQPLSAGAT